MSAFARITRAKAMSAALAIDSLCIGREREARQLVSVADRGNAPAKG
jgi:hypothetical protein